MSNIVEKVVWNLTEFYVDIDDPKIEEDILQVNTLIEKFIKKYKGKINSKDLTVEFLKTALLDHEEIQYVGANYVLYASLLLSKNVTDEKSEIFYQKINEISSEQNTKLTWFGVEWLQLEDEIADSIIEDPLLSEYKHSLLHSRLMKKHTLSEKEEVLLSKTAITGADAFTRLFDLVDTDTKYEFEVEGELKHLSFPELSNYLSYDPDREVRERASNSFTKGLKDNEKIYSFIMNNLLLDSKVGDEVRFFEYPQEATFLLDEINKNVVDSMVETVVDSHGLVEQFYIAKKELLNYGELFEWDRYNNIYPELDAEYTWAEAKKIVLDAFYEFSEDFGKIAEKFFDEGWIDAPMLEGKRSGAFCMMGTPKHHPFVFMNFKGKSRDVMTLAHELGHAIHSYLSKDLPLAEYYPVTPLAEIASIFAEMLVFEKLYTEATNEKIKVNLMVGKIQEIFASVYRQNAFYLFEDDLHKHRREKGELSLEDFNSYFQKRQQDMFGKGLTLTEQHSNWWMYVSHFYHHDFYVYSYVFGELLTLALYQLSKEDETFKDKYLNLLKLGGSKKPSDLLSMFDIDIQDRKLWENGTQYIKGLISEFEKMIN